MKIKISMDTENVYLSATSLLPADEINKRVVFLVDPLVNKSILIRLREFGYEILPKIWSDKNSLDVTLDYLENIYEKLNKKISALLCSIHKVDYPPSLWEIPMATWLIHYIHCLYDRYVRLKKAIELYGKDNVRLFVCRHEFRLPSSYFDFMDKISINENSVSFFYGEVAKKMGIPLFEFYYSQKLQGDLNNYKKKFKNAYYEIFTCLKHKLSNMIASDLFLKRVFLMTPQGFNLKDKLIFLKKLNATFFVKDKIRHTPYKINRQILLSLDSGDEFESIAISLLPKLMPTYLLEDFQAYHKSALPLSDFKAYFSTNSWYSSPLFCYAASLGKLKRAKIIGCQHGGGYGQFTISASEFIERRFCDFYITWGWNDSYYEGARLLPLAQPVLSRDLNQYQPKLKSALWCGTTMPKQLVRFMSYSPDILSQYLNDKKKFIAALEKKISVNLIYRPHPVNFGWSDQEREIFKDFPEIKIENSSLLSELLKKTKLYICDHQSTSFMQAFVINTPTILFWGNDLRSERESASYYFEVLRKAGILFHDPVTAAKQINTIWDDVEGWWLHPERQNARIAFMNNFAKADRNWQKEWTRVFKENINC